jgi:beta-mannosidase
MPKAFLDLNGSWEFREYPAEARRMRDLESEGWMRTEVPSSIFTSLMGSGLIAREQIDTHPEKFEWVSEKAWIYRRSFDVPSEIRDCNRVDLVFEGLDTVASIWLNGKLIGKTNNMFIPHRLDVTGQVKGADNVLMVKFEPAEACAKKLMERYGDFGGANFTNPHRVYLRKAQYQFGWDWGPTLPGCGIWRPVRLEGNAKAGLGDVAVQTVECGEEFADVRIAVKLDRVSGKRMNCVIKMSHEEQGLEQTLVFDEGQDSASTVIRVENPALWFPAGYGKPNVYQLYVTLLCDEEVVDSAQKQIGIRTVRVDQSADEHGRKFEFEVNGQPVYAKGANWVPASTFAGSVTAADYTRLLEAAAEAGVNMLRVWGGGYYEEPLFYEMCDKLGIMVWQDFMFACAYYPDRKWFLDEVRKEAEIIIKRLRNHPSLVLWCGNNENDWLHKIGRFGTGKKFYGKPIYHKLLPQLTSELGGGTDYIPTTPFGTEEEQNTPDFGPYHQWNVWAYHQSARRFLCPPEEIPRFVAEFGMQSIPDMETVKEFCPFESRRIGSMVFEKHNYQLDGNSRLYRYVGDVFGTTGDLEQLVYWSQLMQAREVKTYVENLRAHRHRNSGVLFWQFEDSCPAVSWSAIDYKGRPKALYYYMKRFFANALAAAIPEFEREAANKPQKIRSINLTAINDSIGPLTGTLTCMLLDLCGDRLDEVTFPVSVGPFGSSPPFRLPKAFVYPDRPQRSCLRITINDESRIVAENLYFYLPDKYMEWPPASIARRVERLDESTWKILLSSDVIARDVQISLPGCGKLSDNYINLLGGESYEIKVRYGERTSLPEADLRLRSVSRLSSAAAL